jgi:3-oxoacyl-[acyl-carrier protein] reductase
VDLNLEGRRALVTGGSRGIGRAVTLALAAEGVRVVAGHRTPSPEAESLAEELTPLGGHVVAADVGTEAGARALASAAETQLGGLDVVVTCAGVTEPRLYDAVDPDNWSEQIRTNLTGTHLVLQQALHLLADGGSIIAIGSGLAFAGMPARAAYAASKAGLTGLIRSLIREVGDRGIRVNVVSPGLVETDMLADQPSEARRRFEAVTALHRIGRPAEVAAVVLFLASPASGLVNGVTLPVDGGV